MIVDENYRKQGIGQAMIRFLLNHPDLKDVYQWVLLTKDAHGVYKKAGFNPIANPEGWMEIRHPRLERYLSFIFNNCKFEFKRSLR